MEEHIKNVLIASAEAIAKGLIILTPNGYQLTNKGKTYAEDLFEKHNDLDKLMLSVYIYEALRR